MLDAISVAGGFDRDMRTCALVFDRTDFTFDTNRRLENLIYIGAAALDDEKFDEFNQIVADMSAIYNTGEVCDKPGDPNPDACYPLDPDLYDVMANSRNWSELVWAWEGWRDTCGPPMKPMYPRYVELSNEAALLNDQPDMGAFWRSWYEMEDFEAEVMRLWDEVLPMYEQLHAYVRRKLSGVYGTEHVSLTGAIPAHITGNMWAQDWMSISDIVLPFPNASSIDVTDELINQGYDALQMFQLSEDFFVSMGLIPSPQSFWEDSMFEKPDDGREVTCHASAWDFFNRKDFRIKMCTRVNHEDLITIHHEMGHTQYYYQYAPQPVEYRDGANNGFHEALGDTISLSVQTPEHLYEVGLLPELVQDQESDLNYLMSMALQKVAFLPFGLLIDLWRWEIFDGTITEYNYNERWWHMRTGIQGVVEPVKRSDLAGDFDAGAKYHVPADVPYIRYFVSHILQFQFHEAICEAAGEYPAKPLHHCDVYESHEAGDLLAEMMRPGSSIPWQDVLEAMTGSRDMSTLPLQEFFKPLITYLTAENTKNDEFIGWDINWKPPETPPQVQESLKSAAFDLEARANVSKFDWTNFDPDVMRQLQKIYYIGSSALEGDDLIEYENILADMEQIYSTAKVCESESICIPLDPDLTRLMATSRDYDELKWAWEGWRRETGPEMKDMYENFVTLANKAAKVNDQPDMGAYWRSWYEVDDLKADSMRLWEQLRPFYEQLHAYVRGRLSEHYGESLVDPKRPIPAHLLGNMWAQSWGNILDLVLPYPGKTSIDVTPALVDQGYDALRMFNISEEFFTSLGLIPSPQSFWDDTMFVKPTDGRDVVCHASAWDFYNAKDIRIKMCTSINMEDLITIHHEMGHTQYFLQYKDQPVVYRRGANPGFHEAVGDLLALSVSTPDHLHQIGLLDTVEDDAEADINFLMSMALDKIAFLPFGLLMDLWRWDVFEGLTTKDSYTEAWWKLRNDIQGVEAPVERSDEAGHFDPGAKYHIPGNTPYIRYFISHVLQFQMHRSLCETAGNTRSLHQCDIYRSKEAGKKLGDMLKLGSSKKWPEALEAITGSREMDASAIVDYFKPLMTWLEEKNEEKGYVVGWSDTGITMKPTTMVTVMLAVCTSWLMAV
ncbi:angiotensin-converting enzyme-like [Saccoglossus kowalevskii]